MGSLFLVRHSITAASAGGRNLGRGDDPPLAAAGTKVAGELAATLSAELSELPHDSIRLISSPALRCRQTLEPIARALGLDPASVEIDYGAWDGLTADECLARDPQLRRAWIADPYRTQCPGGESGEQVAERAFGVFDALDAWHRIRLATAS